VFVAGIHGVGKTYLASRVASTIGMLRTSASKLIREERESANWSDDKRVSDVDGNQVALASAVRRYNATGTKLLLDGHFVLLDTDGQMTALEPHVFESLALSAVLLLETEPYSVMERIQGRDGLGISLEHVREFMHAERKQAEKVCAAIPLKLIVLTSPSVKIFAETLSTLVHDMDEKK
jgi:adenylate kinase